MTKYLLSLLLVSSLVLAACSSPRSVFKGDGEESMSYDYDDYAANMSVAPATAGGSGRMMAAAESSIIIDSVDIAEENQKIIRTGSLGLHVEDVRETVEAIEEVLGKWGGSVVYSNIGRGEHSYYASMSVQVESEYFFEAMEALGELAIYVDYENNDAQDVSDVYSDVEARLNNARAEEEQYLEILNTAGTMTEVLEVTKALSQVRYTIESYESQLQNYDERVAYSTIYIELSEDESVSSVTEKWRPLATIRGAFGDWLVFLQDLADGVVYLLIFGWPFALIAWVLWRVLRKRRKGKNK